MYKNNSEDLYIIYPSPDVKIYAIGQKAVDHYVKLIFKGIGEKDEDKIQDALLDIHYLESGDDFVYNHPPNCSLYVHKDENHIRGNELTNSQNKTDHLFFYSIETVKIESKGGRTITETKNSYIVVLGEENIISRIEEELTYLGVEEAYDIVKKNTKTILEKRLVWKEINKNYMISAKFCEKHIVNLSFV
jgi:hypothetical protein